MPKLAASLLVALALVCPGPAGAETLNCKFIETLPAVIDTQGVYCLTGPLATVMTSGNAIDIQANNVVLDLNGFKIAGLGAGPGTNAIGIHSSNRQNITIKNGIIRGFSVGIYLTDSGASLGHVVEDIRADQNRYIGIRVEGAGSIVRHNQVVATGGTTTGLVNASGIYVVGTGPRVLDNDVITTVKQGAGTAWGIQVADSTDALVVNNRISRADKGIEYVASTGKYRDNLTFAVGTPFTGGTDAGNNN